MSHVNELNQGRTVDAPNLASTIVDTRGVTGMACAAERRTQPSSFTPLFGTAGFHPGALLGELASQEPLATRPTDSSQILSISLPLR